MDKLGCTTKISKKNLDRIAKLKISGYEPNDYIINLALGILEKNKEKLLHGNFPKEELKHSTKISKKTLQKLASLKISGYEPNDLIISRALDLYEKYEKKK
ncbi:hypothetical protein A3B93_01900 [Candidatus Nomurabacteria bacterium RIFCSPHIGHO2_02_FULL_42_24]|uniref:Uncharacterized protein n=1 Tax=Candidatus Nomurabacteria bacterium RIFCSPHIGHO2_02_FULL_42_24 TaxID=1801757 RepID=A0A1F6WJN4_9BACT|nr:MAG: hypothetical protein A3B93_01900 [Candidatus Nomurabacteria bacterium RIFCSPHIGHO2_02_FULL_42_24]